MNKNFDFLFFFKGGPSVGDGASLGIEGGFNSGSFNDLVATGAGAEFETQIGDLGISVDDPVAGPGAGVHGQVGVGGGHFINFTSFSFSKAIRNPIATLARLLKAASKTCDQGPRPSC